MRTMTRICLLLALATLIPAGARPALADHRDDLKAAQGAVRKARKAVRKAGKSCREALAANLEMSDSTIGSLRRSATVKTVENQRLFVAGMALAGALAKCPGGVTTQLNRVSHFLTTAKERLQDGGGRSKRRRRSGRGKGWHGDLRRALDALEEVAEDLDDAGRKCRKGIRANLKSIRRQVRSVLDDPDATALRDAKNFMMGLNLAGPLASCDSDVNDGLGEAYRLIYRAHGRYGKRSRSSKGYRRYLKKAARDLEDAREALDDAGKKCRKGLRANLKRAARDLEDLEDDASARGIKDAEQFVAGLVLAARLARCPGDVKDDIEHAKRMLKKARRAY